MCLLVRSRWPIPQRRIEAFKLLAVPCDRTIVVSPFCHDYHWQIGRNEARGYSARSATGIMQFRGFPLYSGRPLVSAGTTISEGVIHASLRHRRLYRTLIASLGVRSKRLGLNNPSGYYFGIARVQIYPQDFVAWGYSDEIAAKAAYLSEYEYAKLLVGRARVERRLWPHRNRSAYRMEPRQTTYKMEFDVDFSQ